MKTKIWFIAMGAVLVVCLVVVVIVVVMKNKSTSVDGNKDAVSDDVNNTDELEDNTVSADGNDNIVPVQLYDSTVKSPLSFDFYSEEEAFTDYKGFQCITFPDCSMAFVHTLEESIIRRELHEITLEVEYYWTNPGDEGTFTIRGNNENGNGGTMVELTPNSEGFVADAWTTWKIDLKDIYFGTRSDGAELYLFSKSSDHEQDVIYVRSIKLYETGNTDKYLYYGPALSHVIVDASSPSNVEEKLQPYQDRTLSFEERASDLVSRMTVEEKLSQFSSNNTSIPRLGVAAYDYWTEALHGVARLGAATSFPYSISMGATWDTELILKIADATSDEARGYANGTGRGLNYFSPTINLYRDPRWGRSNECYSEDVLLTSLIGKSFVDGLEGDDATYLKTNATIKHFAANNSEFNRHSGTSDMDTRTLLEYYTRAFKYITLNARISSVMGAYNSVNGVPMSTNAYLLKTLLRNTWGFDGFVVSDCGAIMNVIFDHKWQPDKKDILATGVKEENAGSYVDANGRVTTAGGTALALLAGTDLNCGDAYNNYLLEALNLGLIDEADLDIALVRIYTSRFATGEFDDPEYVDYRSAEYSYENQVENSAHKQLAEDSADQAIVLLKNEPAKGESTPLLPLSTTKKNVVVVGGIANEVILGDYSGSPSEINCSTPLQGIQNILGTSVKYIPTNTASGFICNMKDVYLKDADGNILQVLKAAAAAECSDCQVENNNNIGFIYNEAYVKFTGVDTSKVASIAVEISGAVNNCSQGTAEIHLNSPDGLLLTAIDTDYTSSWTDYQQFEGKTGGNGGYNVADVYVVFTSGVKSTGFTEEEKVAIKKADTVIVCAGTHNGDSSESNDRETLELPNSQSEMIKSVAALNKKTVVYLQTVSMVDVEEFKNDAAAILWCSYNGQAQGNAMARVIFGMANPCAKLPFTWYANENQLPKITDYSIRSSKDSQGRTYMYFNGDVSYEFGYGLSYTKFAYSNLSVNADSVTPNDTFTVTVDVTNTGKLYGAEIVELYMASPKADGVTRPYKALMGFDKVWLEAGETKTVTLEVDAYQLYFCEEDNGKLTYDLGNYMIEVGASSKDIRCIDTIELTGTLEPVLQAVTLDYKKMVIDSDIKETIEDTEVSIALKDDTFLNPSDAEVVYSSSAPAIASVDDQGVVTANNPGVCSITVSVTYLGKTMMDSYSVVVAGSGSYLEQEMTDKDVTIRGMLPGNGYFKVFDLTEGNYFYELLMEKTKSTDLIVYDLCVLQANEDTDLPHDLNISIPLPENDKNANVYAMNILTGEISTPQVNVTNGVATFSTSGNDIIAIGK
ncbi:MAG: glycoside hydrolase family 3 domain protein [Herbinix sp.]|jgi:beta-glucosidase-like glycosyl hydrolase|nr:glycoside hydrolase family 3 domain protein [Herbinix sp.]